MSKPKCICFSEVVYTAGLQFAMNENQFVDTNNARSKCSKCEYKKVI